MKTFQLLPCFAFLNFLLTIGGCDVGGNGPQSLSLPNEAEQEHPARVPPFNPNPPQALNVAPSSMIFFGTSSVGGMNVVRELVVSNSASTPIKKLKVYFESQTAFAVQGSDVCAEISAFGNCIVRFAFLPKVAGNFEEIATITYENNGRKQSSIVRLKANSDDTTRLEIDNNLFGTKKLRLGEKGKISLNIEMKDGLGFASDFQIVGSPNFIMTKGPSSSCLGNNLFVLGSCTIELETKNVLSTHESISEKLILKYRLNNEIDKEFHFSLNGKFQFSGLYIGKQDIGQVNIASGVEWPIKVRVDNPSGSSIPFAKSIELNQAALPRYIKLDADPTKSTCLALGLSLLPGQHCDFVLNAKPKNDAVLADDIKVTYKPVDALGQSYSDQELSFRLTGSFKLLPVLNPIPLGPSGSPSKGGGGSPAYLTLSPADFGARKFDNDSFDVKLEIKNTSVSLNDLAKGFVIERRDQLNKANVVVWPATYFVQKSNSSTCGIFALTAGKTCNIVLTITPYQTEIDAINEPFAITYTDLQNAKHEFLFDLKGSWTSNPPPPTQLLSNYIFSLADRYYKKPYINDPTDYVRRLINGQSIQVNRPNHAFAHGARKSALALDAIQVLTTAGAESSNWIAYFNNPWSPQYNQYFVQQLSFGALMMRTGRSTERNDAKIYTEDTARSAKYFKQEAPKTGLFPNNKDIDDFTFALETVGDKGKCFDTKPHPMILGQTIDEHTIARGCSFDRLYVYRFLYGVHHLDLRRVAGFDKNRIVGQVAAYFTLYSNDPLNDPLIKKLWGRSGKYLKITGDHDIEDNSSPPFRVYGDIFYKLSNDIKSMRETVEAQQKIPF